MRCTNQLSYSEISTLSCHGLKLEPCISHCADLRHKWVLMFWDATIWNAGHAHPPGRENWHAQHNRRDIDVQSNIVWDTFFKFNTMKCKANDVTLWDACWYFQRMRKGSAHVNLLTVWDTLSLHEAGNARVFTSKHDSRLQLKLWHACAFQHGVR